MKIYVVYDGSVEPNDNIRDIIGDKGFGNVIVKRQKLSDIYQKQVSGLKVDELCWQHIGAYYEFEALKSHICRDAEKQEVRVIHCFSNFIITDKTEVNQALAKAAFITETTAVKQGGKVAAVMFPDGETYGAFLDRVLDQKSSVAAVRELKALPLNATGFGYIGSFFNFVQCITGHFDSRYFNALKGNEYTLTKTSKNKKKIKAEYTFYHLLPEDMRFWFVMPFNYTETATTASYTMERLHMTDLAVKWVHGSMDEEEFSELMDRYFYFFRSRHEKPCDQAEYNATARALYVDKVNKRVAELKQCPEYARIEALLAATPDADLDALVARYFALKDKIESRHTYPAVRVIGHGDPCFSNALYNKATKTLKLIDPKGALTEAELWTNPYYDIAKLSHSVCGRYDFFNNGIYDIHIDEHFGYRLEIPFDNTKYVSVFRKKVAANGLDYLTVRIYEASLFLSMLPLHIDNPHKVFAFILNAKQILEEIEHDLK